MKMIFKTQVDERRLVKEILEYSYLIDFQNLLKKSIPYRYKCKMANLNNLKVQEKKYATIALEHSSKDIKFGKYILEEWAMIVTRIVPKIEDKDKLDEQIKSHKEENDYTKEKKFLFICYLWLKDKDKYNKIGDELYKLYKQLPKVHCENLQEDKDETICNKNFKFKDKSDEIISMNIVDENYQSTNLGDKKEEKRKFSMVVNVKENLMNLSIGELINIVVKSNEEEVRLRAELMEKDKEMDRLKKQLNTMLDKRELKKELKTHNKNMLEIVSAAKKENEVLTEKIIELKKDNKQLLECIHKTKEYIRENVTTEIRRDIKNKQTDINNLLKGIVLEAINKNNKIIIDEIQQIVDNKITITNTRVDNEEGLINKDELQENLPIKNISNIVTGIDTNTVTNKTEDKVDKASNNQFDIEKIIEAIKG